MYVCMYDVWCMYYCSTTCSRLRRLHDEHLSPRLDPASHLFCHPLKVDAKSLQVLGYPYTYCTYIHTSRERSNLPICTSLYVPDTVTCAHTTVTATVEQPCYRATCTVPVPSTFYLQITNSAFLRFPFLAHHQRRVVALDSFYHCPLPVRFPNFHFQWLGTVMQ